jgi:hypothetical protein
MANYVVSVTSTIVKKSPAPHAGKNGNLKKDQEIEITDQQNGYGHIDSPLKGWVRMADLSAVEAVPLTSPNTIAEAININPTTEPLDLYRALHGNERPDIGWLGINLGSFDIIPLLPNPKLEKGDPLKLDAAQVDAIRKLNPNGSEFTAKKKWRWLVDEEGNRDVMAYDAINDEYRIPSPGISGGAQVNVLSIVGNFAKIETLAGAIPEDLPSHLVFTWYGFTKTGVLFTPCGGVRFPVLFSEPSAYVPLQWLEKL